MDPKTDTLEIKTKAENNQQAEAKARAALHKKNSRECTGSISITGNTLIIAGNNIELTGMGTLSGIYHIVSSRHTIDRGGGYATSAEIKRINGIDKSKYRPTAKNKSKNSAQLKSVNDINNDYSFNRLPLII